MKQRYLCAKDGSFFCRLCGAKLYFEKSIYKHLTQSHPGVRRVVTHAINSSKGQEQESKSSHKKQKTAQQLIKALGHSHSCTLCGAKFSFRNNALRHLRNVHKETRRFDAGDTPNKEVGEHQEGLESESSGNKDKIKLSNAVQENKSSQEKQKTTQKFIKVKDQKYICTICGAKFSFNSNAFRHLKNVHPETRRRDTADATNKRVINNNAEQESESSGNKDTPKVSKKEEEKENSGQKIETPQQSIKFKGHKYFCSLCGTKFGFRSGANRHLKYYRIKEQKSLGDIPVS